MKKRIFYIRSIINIVIFSIMLLIVFIFPLRAILDGRTASIYLDTVYTFTQGEWARGSVFFRKGFDLPVGGTLMAVLSMALYT